MGSGVSRRPWPPGRIRTPDGGLARARRPIPGFNIRVPSLARSKPGRGLPLGGDRLRPWCMLPDLWTTSAIMEPRGARIQGSALAVTGSDQACRTISTGHLSALLRVQSRPIDVVVCHGPQGYLVSRGASRLDAFSGYPVRSWPPGTAAGATTGPPVERSPRSSRTRGNSSQVSYTHGR